MTNVLTRLTTALLIVTLSVLLPTRALGTAMQEAFTEQQLDELLAPIALYPDPLLAQVLPASTFVDQLGAAGQLLGGKVDNNLIDKQEWDVSVKAVAHYPTVLQKLNADQNWTIALGQAFVNQSTDVTKSIQRLRAEAKEAGTLVTTPQQKVVVEGQYILITPAEPQVIYVPQYSPEVVYVKQAPSAGAVAAASAIAFGTGLAIGAWLNRDWHWHSGIYYHGWVGGGWIGYNRAHINVNRNIYINNSFSTIHVDRTVVRRDINVYRADLNRRATVRYERNVNVNRDVNVNRTTNVNSNANVNPNRRANGNAKAGAANTNRANNAGTAGANNGGANRERMQQPAQNKAAGAKPAQAKAGGAKPAASGKGRRP